MMRYDKRTPEELVRRKPARGCFPPIGLIRKKHRPGSGHNSEGRRMAEAPAMFAVFRVEPRAAHPVCHGRARRNDSQLRCQHGHFVAHIHSGLVYEPASVRTA